MADTTAEGQGQLRSLRVAMALYADVTHDSRVLREAETLALAGHSVTIHCLAGFGPPDGPFRVVTHAPRHSSVLPGERSASVGPERGRPWRRILWAAGYARNLRSWGQWAIRAAGDVDVWHVHDLTALLAIAPLVRAPTRLVYDSHEIFLEAGGAARLPDVLRGLLGRLERRLSRQAAALVTVNEGYAEVLRQRLRPRKIVIVRNCPPVRQGTNRDGSPLRHSLDLAADVPLLLYHGVFSPYRGIEETAEALLQPGLERAHLAVLGFGSLRETLAARSTDARFGARLHIVDAVPPAELLDWVEGADVDIIALQPTTLNHWLCTPNKLWESLAAGVPVVVSDFPMMTAIVGRGPEVALGVHCDPTDPASIAAAIRSIIELPTEAGAAMRARCREAARERWNWEVESGALVGLYAELASSRPSRSVVGR